MDETLQDRLLSAIAASGMTQQVIADAIGITQPTLSELLNTPGAGSTKVVELAEVLCVHPLWLATGRGSRFELPTCLNDEETKLLSSWRLLSFESRRLIGIQLAALVREEAE
ncbi:MAG: helix-turn-helix transcriptional regulator [Pseudomonadota bacterium]